MKTKVAVKSIPLLIYLIAAASLLFMQPATAQESTQSPALTSIKEGGDSLLSPEAIKNAAHPHMTQTPPGDSVSAETYIIMDTTGGVTRSLCPYTCADRGLPNQYCRTWRSIESPGECYVQDKRIPSKLFPNM